MRLEDGRQLSASPRASPLLSQKVLQRRVVQHGIGQQPLQSRVLVFQRPHPLSLGDVQAAESGLPFVDARVAHAVLAAEIGDRHPGLVLLQYPMICSSEKRLRFMLWSSYWARANFKLD